MHHKSAFLKAARYIVGGLMCYAGSLALFNGEAFSGVMIRGQGAVARLAGVCFIVGGVMLIFDKWKLDDRNDGHDP